MACDFFVTALAPILLVPVILMVLPRSEALQGGTTSDWLGGILFGPRRRRLAGVDNLWLEVGLAQRLDGRWHDRVDSCCCCFG